MIKIDSNLLAAFVGAVTGGAASLAGSIYVGRRDLTRKTRIRMYHDLIPPIQEDISRLIEEESQSPEPRKEIYRAVKVLARESVLAGRIDSRKLAVLENLCNDQQTSYEKLKKHREQGRPQPPPKGQSETTRLDQEYQQRLAEAASRGQSLSNIKRGTSPVIEQYRAAQVQWDKELEEYTADFFKLDQCIAEQLNELHQFLRRKIR
jgi:hypothetical protein